MENGKIKVWLPAIKSGSGADVYTRRLAAALERHGMATQITWFPLSHELFPFLMGRVQPPSGTDMIIANSWNAFSFRRFGLPLLAVVHHCSFDPDLRRYKSVAQSLYHRLIAEPREVSSLRGADAVVAVSRCVADHLRQRGGLDNAEVIHNWVDTDLFRPSLLEDRGGRPFRLLFVGRPTSLKGGDLLAPLMRRLGASFELRITTEPQDVQKISPSASMISIGRLAELEMVKAYQQCDAVLLPSRAEGFGYVALEAMACGKPVIASNNTALPEIVADGVTGILCNTDDIEVFANACRLLLGDVDLCAAMGCAGRQRAEESFSEARSIESYILLMERLLRPAQAFRSDAKKAWPTGK